MKSEKELMDEAAEPVVYSDVYYGKCLMTFWEGKFPRDENNKIVGKPVRWNEGDDPKQRLIMVDMMLDLCAGCTSNYPIQFSLPKHDKDLQKIIIPSLVELGAVKPNGDADFSLAKDHFVKLQQVEGTRPRDKNDPDKGHWNTYKFLAIYQSEEECLNAMALDNGEDDLPGVPAASTAPKKRDSKQDQRRAAALEFCRVAIGTYKGMKAEEIKQAAQNFIQSNPNVKPFVTIDDPEITEMISEASIPF